MPVKYTKINNRISDVFENLEDTTGTTLGSGNKVEEVLKKVRGSEVDKAKASVGLYENPADGSLVDDFNYSILKAERTKNAEADILDGHLTILDDIKKNFNILSRQDIDLFDKRYRFGIFNPYETVSTTKEYLFFTKPDLNIYGRDINGKLRGGMVDGLKNLSFWKEMDARYKNVIELLQGSYGKSKKNKFNHLLANTCISNLSVPSLDAETIDTANNIYGVGLSYRGSSEAGNDSFEFDLEFKDTAYLPVYHFFKMYEEYETLKHHGTIGPWQRYVEEKIIHDQFSIYKFLVGEDGETIIYYCKYCGVMPKSLPRDVFSSADFDNGLSYSISFKAAFFEDMDPIIINDFNLLSAEYFNTRQHEIGIYNDVLDRTDARPVQSAIVVAESGSYVNSNITQTRAPGGKVYKLKWRGDDIN